MTDLSRRRFVLGTGAVVAAGALAGCGGNGNGGNGNGGNGNGGNGNGNGNGNGGGDGPQGRAEAFLNDNDANGFDGMADHTGEDEVTVSVGAGDNGFAFDPAGIVVDSGTTVVWEWTGEGAAHNVVPESDSDFSDFGTEERVDEAGHTVEYTFEESGAGLYVCQPHRSQGMYGAVAVE